jgi:PIH1 N-terminal domain
VETLPELVYEAQRRGVGEGMYVAGNLPPPPLPLHSLKIMAAGPNSYCKTSSKQAEKEAFSFSQSEIERIRAAVKDEEFVRLLGQYARELSDPENRRRYEADIAALESERGYQVTFLNPRPGYVIKTQELSGGGGVGRPRGNKIFINICCDKNVGQPSSEAAGTAGLKWSIPYSLSQPRKDCDKSGEPCMGKLFSIQLFRFCGYKLFFPRSRIGLGLRSLQFK